MGILRKSGKRIKSWLDYWLIKYRTGVFWGEGGRGWPTNMVAKPIPFLVVKGTKQSFARVSSAGGNNISQGRLMPVSRKFLKHSLNIDVFVFIYSFGYPVCKIRLLRILLEDKIINPILQTKIHWLGTILWRSLLSWLFSVSIISGLQITKFRFLCYPHSASQWNIEDFSIRKEF